MIGLINIDQLSLKSAIEQIKILGNSKYQNAKIEIILPKVFEDKLNKVMAKDGAVAKELMSIRYLLHHPEMAVFIKYDDLVINPEQEIRKVYTFLNLPYYSHYFTSLEQVVVNGLSYNDGIVGKNMHTIRTEKIMKVENEYKNKIPERFVKEYGHITF